MASYNDFTVQELERAAKRVLSQNKRYTYSSNKLQPSERMRGSKVTGGRRKTNRPSTPSLKTSQQIYHIFKKIYLLRIVLTSMLILIWGSFQAFLDIRNTCFVREKFLEENCSSPCRKSTMITQEIL